MSKRLIQTSLGWALVLTTGCQFGANKPEDELRKGAAVKAPTTQYAPAQVAATPRPTREEEENAAAAAAALAARVQTVTQNLEPLVAKRNHPSPSGVQWGDSYSLHLSDVPPAKGNGGGGGERGMQNGSPSGVEQGNAAAPAAQAAYVVSPRPVTQVPGPTVAPAAATAEGWAEKIAQRARDYPHDTAAQLDYQLLLFLKDEQVPQLDALTALSKEDQEIMAATIDALANYRMVLRADDNAMAARKVRPMMEMADRLRAEAELSISTVALCTKVDGFGRYEPIEPLRFAAGRENPAILYCELENFSSQQQPDEKRMWMTRLQEQATLYTEGGLPVWNDQGKGLSPGAGLSTAAENPREIVDLARNRRHDFCLAKRINLPSTLSVGRYVLKVSIIDQQAHRIAEATLGVQVVAQ